MSINFLNSSADVLRADACLQICTSSAYSLSRLLRPSFGPNGKSKLLVSAGGIVRMSKDGGILLKEMQISQPIALMIAKIAAAIDEDAGDGTITAMIILGELIRNAEDTIIGISKAGVQRSFVARGIDIASQEIIKFIEQTKIKVECNPLPSAEILASACRTAINTKLSKSMVNRLTPILVEAFQTIAIPCMKELETPTQNPHIDLFRIEVLSVKHGFDTETRFIQGMVLDHGSRHPDMPNSLKNCYILVCNVSLEYEKSEVHSSCAYRDAEHKQRLVEAERDFTDAKVRKIIELKRKICTKENGKNFVVMNQKGIDPLALDLLAKENIIALRRVKRRNMERLTLCCGGNPVNAVDDLSIDDLGQAGHVYEQIFGDEKWTFVEQVENCKSCAILIKGSNELVISRIKDTIKDGLRTMKNLSEDKAYLAGGGAFEMGASTHLKNFAKTIPDKTRYGVLCVADAFQSVVRAMAENSGIDAEDAILALEKAPGYGLDLITGKPIDSVALGIIDICRVKRQLMSVVPPLAQRLICVDEIIRAGKSMNPSQPGA